MPSCGTGSGNFPQPGDPDLSGQTLSAQAVHGGIMVRWTYPTLLSQAVAHTLLYKGTSSDFNAAVLLDIATGAAYFHRADGLEDTTTYHYWVKLVSVNGTVGNLIGPATATMDTQFDSLSAALLSAVTESQLSADLKTRIDQIDGFNSLLSAEEAARLFGEETVTALVASLQEDLDDVDTLVFSEITERIDGDAALVTQINALIVVSDDNAAAIVTEAAARATADTAIAATVTSLTATVGSNTAAITTEATARASADTAMAGTVTTLSATVAGNSSSIGIINTVLSGVSAQYMVKLDVNGFVSGFGIYSTGATSDFIVHATNFAVGHPSYTTKYPFTVGYVNGVAVISMDAAVFIQDATINTLTIAGNAVTVPAAVSNSSSLVLTDTYQTLDTVTINMGSNVSPVLLQASVWCEGSGSSGVNAVILEISKGGAVIGEIAHTIQSGWYITATAVVTAASQTGSCTYSLRVKKFSSASPVVTALAYSLTAFGVKR